MKKLIIAAVVAIVAAGSAYAAETAKAPAMTMEGCQKHMKDGKMSDMPKDMMEQCRKMIGGSMMSGGSMASGGMATGSASTSASASASASSSSSSVTPEEHAAHHP
jgi:hypothetical protein